MKQLTTQQVQWLDGQVPPKDPSADGMFSSIINSLFQLGGVVVPYTSNVTPDTLDNVPHTLGRVPVGYIAIQKSKAGVVYNGGAAGAFSATATAISLKCNIASTVVTLLVF